MRWKFKSLFTDDGDSVIEVINNKFRKLIRDYESERFNLIDPISTEACNQKYELKILDLFKQYVIFEFKPNIKLTSGWDVTDDHFFRTNNSYIRYFDPDTCEFLDTVIENIWY